MNGIESSRLPLVLRPGYIVPLLMVMSAVSRGVVAFTQEAINVDAVRYINAAHLLSEGRFLEGIATSQYMPALPVLIWFVHLFTSDWVVAGRIVSVLSLSVAVLPIYLLSRALFDHRVACWATAAFALSPSLAGYGAEILREPPFLLFFSGALYFAVQALQRRRSRDFLVSGALTLLALLCRLEAVLFPALFLGWLAISACRHPERRRGLLRGGAFFALPFLPIVAGVIAGGSSLLRFDYVSQLSTEIFSRQGFQGYLRAQESLVELERLLEGGQWDNDFAQTARHFLPLIYLLGLLHALADALFLPFAALAAVGVGWGGRPERRFLHLLSIVFFLTAGLFLLRMNFVSDRYLLGAALPLFPFIGAGLERLRQKVEGRKIFSPALIIFLFLAVPSVGTLSKLNHDDPTIRLAGEWLAGLQGRHLTMICNDERVAFHAGRWRGGYVHHPLRNFDSMGEIARQEGIDLLAVRVAARQFANFEAPEGFLKLKEFVGSKHAVIFCRRVEDR